MSPRSHIRFLKRTRIEPDLVGNTSANGNPAGSVFWQPILASRSGALVSVGLNIKTAAGNIRTALYSIAGALLAESASVAVAAGWNDPSVTGVNIVANTEYVVAFQLSSLLAYSYYRAGTGSFLAYKAQAYAAFPASLPAGATLFAGTENMRLTYT